MRTKILYLIIGVVWMITQPSFASLTELGPIETKVWKAYYAKNMQDAQTHLKKFIELQYQISDATTTVPGFLQTMIQFSSLPMNTPRADYDSKILPKLTKVFEDIRGMTFLNFDPATLARAELEWWVARRDPKLLDFESVGNLMAKTYVLLYGGKESNYRKPAFLRAFAARYRDVCQELLEKDWQLVELILTAAYECLENNLQKQPST